MTLATLELLLGWFRLVALLSHRWVIPTPVPPHLRALLPAALCAALFVSFSPTCQATARAVVFSVPAWSRAVHLHNLDLQRQAAAGLRQTIALAAPDTPVIYFDFVLAPSPQARPNYFAARYFGFATITTAYFLDAAPQEPPRPLPMTHVRGHLAKASDSTQAVDGSGKYRLDACRQGW